MPIVGFTLHPNVISQVTFMVSVLSQGLPTEGGGGFPKDSVVRILCRYFTARAIRLAYFIFSHFITATISGNHVSCKALHYVICSSSCYFA